MTRATVIVSALLGALLFAPPGDGQVVAVTSANAGPCLEQVSAHARDAGATNSALLR
jgi:hypothetical protein